MKYKQIATILLSATLLAGCAAPSTGVTAASTEDVSSVTQSTSILQGNDDPVVSSASDSQSENKDVSSDSTSNSQVTDANPDAAESATDVSANETQTQSTGDPTTIAPVESLDLDNAFSDSDLNTDISDNAETIDLSEIGIAEITQPGDYIISGKTDDGGIIVDISDTEKVHLLFSGVSIKSNGRPAVFVKQADKVIITLEDGTENVLSDTSAAYTQTDDGSTQDAVIFSRSDLSINGKGSLAVNGVYKHGIVSKDDLVIAGGSIQLNANDKGLVGEDSVRIKDADIVIKSVSDAIHSDTTDKGGKGYIYIRSGNIRITTEDDGIHAATSLIVDGGDIVVEESKEGLEGAVVVIRDGNLDIVSTDDGINAAYKSAADTADVQTQNATDQKLQQEGTSDASTEIPDNASVPGNETIGPEGQAAQRDQMNTGAASAESGVHNTPSDQTGNVPQGTPPQGTPPQISGGGIPTQMPDNTGQAPGAAPPAIVNQEAGGGSDPQSGPASPWMTFTDEVQEGANIVISGGNIHIDSEGDGLDANGKIEVTGGSILVDGPSTQGNGPLDASGGIFLNGGSFVSFSSAGMIEIPRDDSNQKVVIYTHSGNIPAGTDIEISDESGNVIYSGKTGKAAQSVIASTPEMTGDTYTVSIGGEKTSVNAA